MVSFLSITSIFDNLIWSWLKLSIFHWKHFDQHYPVNLNPWLYQNILKGWFEILKRFFHYFQICSFHFLRRMNRLYDFFGTKGTVRFQFLVWFGIRPLSLIWLCFGLNFAHFYFAENSFFLFGECQQKFFTHKNVTKIPMGWILPETMTELQSMWHPVYVIAHENSIKIADILLVVSGD